MAQIIPSLASVLDDYDAVFCDLWGCLHNGKVAFPAAVAALQKARAMGKKVVLLTNSPRPKASVAAQLDGLSVPRGAWDEIVTSGDAAQYALVTGAVGHKIYPIAAAKDEPFFSSFAADIAAIAADQPALIRVDHLNDAEGIVCTGLRDDLTETPDDYRAELLLAKTLGLKMLCANPDIIVDFGERRLYCAGALAQEYENMGGTALYFGKPHPPIYDLARRRLAALGVAEDARILVIGDGLRTDVQGGISEGLDVLFITGGIESSAFGNDPAQPDAALLNAWLEEKMIAPLWAMGHLA